MRAFRSRAPSVRVLAACVVAGVALIAANPRLARAQPAIMPQPALLPSYSPLCDSNLVGCLDIDDLAGHVYAHLLILPATELRGTAVSIPYGLTIGVLGRLAVGASTSYTFWWQGSAPYQGHSPLRLSATLLLWPLFPLRPRMEMPADDAASGNPHFIPPRRLRIGITYEHELRIGPFDGPNTLGVLTDLSVVRLVAAKALGPVELTLSLGALIDPQRQFATGEAAAEIGLYLPFFKSLKLSAEALGRGVPSGVQPDLFALAGATPIRAQGVLGLALSYRPQARVDLGVSAQMGFGGLAPVAVIVRFAVLSLGKLYQGRSATPITDLVADAATYVATAAATRLREYIASLPIDPKLDENCIIRDDDGSYMGHFGKRTADRQSCEQDGFRVPIGHQLLRDKASDRLCRDSRKNPRSGKRDLYDCLLWRHGKEWLPAYQARLNDKCELRDSENKMLAQVGTPSTDGMHCRYPVTRENSKYGGYTTYEEEPVGEILYTDAERGRVCENPNLTRCFIEHADGRSTLRMSPAERFARGADRGIRHKAEAAQAAAETAEGVATGQVALSAVADEVRKEITEVAKTVTDRDKLQQVAKEKTEDWLKKLSDWQKKPLDDQIDDAGELTASAAVDGLVDLATGAAGHLAGGLIDAGEDLGKLRKHAKAPKHGKGAATATHAPHAPPAHPSEPPQLRAGKRAHREEPVLPGEKKEVETPSGRRMDRYNEQEAHIREIKPDNPRQVRAGQKQVEGYRREMEQKTGRPHTTEVTPYDPKKYR